MRKWTPWILLSVLLAVGLVAIGTRILQTPFTLSGSVIEPPGPAPELDLVTPDGSSFRLESLRGRIVLLFFGYTNCPDICPGTLADMKLIFEQMGASRSEVAFVFVTVDPARDTPERIAKYLASFHPEFIGLTGTPEQLETVYEAYNVGVARQPAAGAVGYEVEHISRIFVIDQDGDLIETFPYGIGREVILRDVQYLVSTLP